MPVPDTLLSAPLQVTPDRVLCAAVILQLYEMYLLTGCYRYKAEGMQVYYLYFRT